MAGITRFEEIDAWITSRHLTNLIYFLSNQAGFSRDFGLRDQIRRASVSVMSNIAEGFESRTDVQFINLLGMARASAGEVRSQLYIAYDQKYISEEQFKETCSIVEKCSRQISGFISYLESSETTSQTDEKRKRVQVVGTR
jgi:four helix bundle protein